jgi:hypothetical protein
MEEQKNKPGEDDNSSKAVVERGKKAVEADEQLNKKDLTEDEKKSSAKADAEKWRNEG